MAKPKKWKHEGAGMKRVADALIKGRAEVDELQKMIDARMEVINTDIRRAVAEVCAEDPATFQYHIDDKHSDLGIVVITECSGGVEGALNRIFNAVTGKEMHLADDSIPKIKH